MTAAITLREVAPGDLPVFFRQQLDPEAVFMAAFTAKDPADEAAFDAHWRRIMADPAIVIRTIVAGDQVAGYVTSYVEGGRPEVSYWLGREFWGQGLATQALDAFLAGAQPARPIYARAAKDNRASLRVLEKCGFAVVGEDRGFANARGAEIEEFVLRRDE
jgi:RimJ/RimL family protein N-acetyltransferase